MTSTRVAGTWVFESHGRWSLHAECPCGSAHRIADGGCGPAPRLRGSAIFRPRTCSRADGWRGQLVTVTPRLNPMAGQHIEAARGKLDEAAQALLSASDVVEQQVERDELRRLSRKVVQHHGRLRLLNDLAVVHPAAVESVLAGST